MRKIINIFLHYIGTTKHKFWVAYYLLKFCFSLLWRAIIHDISKYTPSESAGFVKVIHKLKSSTYNSEEYKKHLKKIEKFIEIHYKRNSHHPEYYFNGINGMTLVDFVEMWCDWNAAVRRHKNGDIKKSIHVNKDRFLINKQLIDILNN